jgi:signal transduction histidine kinase
MVKMLRKRTEFVNVAAHELRSPAQSILGYAEWQIPNIKIAMNIDFLVQYIEIPLD